MIKKKKRQELYGRFRQGAIPTGADFADLIRSNLNLLDDGIDIPDNPDEPVIFRGRGEDQNLIDIADSKGTKKWRLSGLSLKRDRESLNIKSDNRDRVFIARETGNTGLGTDSPEARLHIKQTGSEDAFRVDDENSDTTPFVITSDGNVGIGKGGGDEKPLAKLHINNGNSPADAFRVDDADDDTTPFVINCDGKIGI